MERTDIDTGAEFNGPCRFRIGFAKVDSERFRTVETVNDLLEAARSLVWELRYICEKAEDAITRKINRPVEMRLVHGDDLGPHLEVHIALEPVDGRGVPIHHEDLSQDEIDELVVAAVTTLREQLHRDFFVCFRPVNDGVVHMLGYANLDTGYDSDGNAYRAQDRETLGVTFGGLRVVGDE